MSLAKEIIKAAAADLTQNAGLPKHNLIRYRRPRFIQPQDCPLLMVVLSRKTPLPVETMRFPGVVGVDVGWFLATVDEAETLINDEGLSEELIDGFDLIETRVRHWALHGLPNTPDAAWQVRPGEASYPPPGDEESLTEGYGMEVLVDVVET